MTSSAHSTDVMDGITELHYVCLILENLLIEECNCWQYF